MKLSLKMQLNKKALALLGAMALGLSAAAAAPDSVATAAGAPLQWRVGVEALPAVVPGSNGFLRGDNLQGRRIGGSLSGSVRADFSFGSSSREGMLYRGLYQGIGVGVNSFFAGSLLGTPASVYVYQGAPIARLGRRLWLGYEWRFGAAFGWRHHEDAGDEYNNAAVSTAVTAHMGVGLKLHYELSPQWRIAAGIEATHFSNGNTSLPNAGVNAVGVSLGVSYVINPQPEAPKAPEAIAEEADRGRWFFDIMAYGAWRRRAVAVGEDVVLCPGRFGVAGLQLAPMRSLNRYVAVGGALDLQYDESAGLAPYYVESTNGGFVRFYRPPFGKQLSAGVSAHAELTMPIFAINAGLGINMLNPKGDKRFYQMLTLKAFVHRNVFLNVGYRLGRFSDPQNLMLGIGVRL